MVQLARPPSGVRNVWRERPARSGRVVSTTRPCAAVDTALFALVSTGAAAVALLMSTKPAPRPCDGCDSAGGVRCFVCSGGGRVISQAAVSAEELRSTRALGLTPRDAEACRVCSGTGLILCRRCGGSGFKGL